MDEGTGTASRPRKGTQVTSGESSAHEQDIDSVTASRAAAILFLASIIVGIVCGFATWLFVAASHYGIELLWHTLPEAVPAIPAAGRVDRRRQRNDSPCHGDRRPVAGAARGHGPR